MNPRVAATPSTIALPFLQGYPEPVLQQVRDLMANGQVTALLAKRYPDVHAVRTDRALQEYTMDLKGRYLKSAITPSKIVFDNRLQVMRDALGTHTRISRVQGGKLVAKREIRIDSVFIDAPAAFLEMIVVHELSHLKEADHNKAFYQLCRHMSPNYHQLEFDLRLYLSNQRYLAQCNATLKGS